jgi:hypothetical protein
MPYPASPAMAGTALMVLEADGKPMLAVLPLDNRAALFETSTALGSGRPGGGCVLQTVET